MFYAAINRPRPHATGEAIAAVIPDHIAWIEQQLAAGSLVQAGKWGTDSGIWIIRAGSEGAARALLGDDPLLCSGLFDIELGEFLPNAKVAVFE